jgi:hypothetical protein
MLSPDEEISRANGRMARCSEELEINRGGAGLSHSRWFP